MTDDLDARTRREMSEAARAGALAELNFGPPITLDSGGPAGMFTAMFGGGFQVASCLTCGALVHLAPVKDAADAEEIAAQPVVVHFQWHRDADR